MALKAVLLLVIVCLSLAAAMHPSERTATHKGAKEKQIATVDSSEKDCTDCANYMLYVVNVVLNEILDGEIKTCAELCAHDNNSVVLHDTCVGICDLIGVKGLVILINRTDPSPIYYCQVIHYCAEVPFKADSINVTSLYVSPESGPAGTLFQIFWTFTVLANTSSGINYVSIFMPDGNNEDGYQITNGMGVGEYSLFSEFQTDKHGFPLGQYEVGVEFCAGDCDTDHPYSGIYANVGAYFNVTQADDIITIVRA